MRTKAVANEVLYPDEPIVRINRDDVAQWKAGAVSSDRRRTRFCAHRSVDDALHEMVIVLGREAYVRPHKHLQKSESFHVIQGQADVVIFEEDGSILEVIPLGEYASGACFYYRLADPLYHGLLVRSEVFVYHETTSGPLEPAQSVFAPWAPPEDALAARAAFLAQLIESTRSWRRESL